MISMGLIPVLCAACAAVGAAEPYFQQELLFPLQEKHVHSSSIIECPNGDLLCAWFHGSGERTSPDVVIRGARRRIGATAWTAHEPWADTPGLPDCNPVLFVDARQELWLFWIAVPAERWEDALLRYRKAKDYLGDGPPQWYWQDDILLKPGEEFAQTLEKGYNQLRDALPALHADFGGYTTPPAEQLLNAARDPSKNQRGWMTRNHALTLPSGRILLPLYSDGFEVGLMAISDDQGQSWRPSAPIPGALLNQPAIVQKQNKHLVAFMREEGDVNKRVLRSVSTDNGDAWSVAEYTDIPNPNASLEVIALRDGRWGMIYNDAQNARDSLALALSDDEGLSWKWSRHLERSTNASFHYPSIIQTRDGRIHASYTYAVDQGKSIKHVALDPEWIIQGD